MREDLWAIFNNVNEWLKFAEAKNGVLLAFNNAIIFGSIGVFYSHQMYFIGLKWFIMGMVVMLVLSNSVVFLSFLPKRVNLFSCKMTKHDLKRNLIFYGDVSLYSPHEYLEQFTVEKAEKKEKELLSNLVEQIIVNSKIAKRKYDLFSVAIVFMAIGMFIISIGGIIKICNDSV